ncbi:MAG: Smr/MutS family protein [Rikenellaceae bacterium]
MIYPDTFESKIGFTRLRAQIAQLCTTSGAKSKIEATTFSSDYNQVVSRLTLCNQMMDLVIFNNKIGSVNFVDTSHFLDKAKVEGHFLDIDEVVTIHKALTGVSNAVNIIREADASKYYALQELSSNVNSFPEIIGHIDFLIDKFGKIKDSASNELYEIRRKLRSHEGEVSKRLQRILSQAQSAGYVDPEATLSVRDGRTVIPVSASNKKKIAGFIHDESATGKTFYIEPVEIVELNNEIRELEYAERREIIRILVEFTDLIRPNIEAIKDSGDYLTTIDMLVAKARFSIDNRYACPIIEREPMINIRKGRHPLLEQTLKRDGAEVVPLDVALDKSNRILVISGPNAGGKSVCLKTVGILQYMVQCGFAVPTLENSEFGIFDNIFIDIGDEQSIDNDLSTYSSHLLNMKNMLRGGNNRSLILIDEFGSGTEPIIGGALAESMLEKYVDKGCFGVITTHYANIKYFATNTDGVMGGAMSFDVQNIRPLFKLELGKPGSSFAIEIARKSGISEDIIASASAKAGTDHISIEKQLREIARDKRYWENKRDKIRQNDKRVEELTERYQSELSNIKAERARILKEAKAEAQRITAEANKQIENTIRTIKESQADKEKTLKARREMEQFKDKVAQVENKDSSDIDRKIEQLRQRKERRAKNKEQRKGSSEQTQQAAPKVLPIVEDSHVRIKDQNAVGKVIKVDGKKATIVMGHITSTVALNRLVAISNNEFSKIVPASSPAPKQQTNYDTMQKRVMFRENIDVRGMRVVEALEQVQDFVDEAIMLGFSDLRILHGKGTGALKEEIRSYLRTTGYLKSAKDEREENGGAGITVVKLDL